MKLKKILKPLFLLAVLAVAATVLFGCGKSSKSNGDSGGGDNQQQTTYYTVRIYDGSQLIRQERYDPRIASEFRLPKQTKKGKIFAGYADADGILYFDAEGTSVGFLIESDLVLYCRWESQAFDLSLNPDGGKLSAYENAVISGVLYETNVPNLPVPEKEGFDFLGWKNANGVFVSDGEGRILEGKTTLNAIDYPFRDGSNTVGLTAAYDVKKLTVTLFYAYDRQETRTVVYNEALHDLPTGDDGSQTLVGWSNNPYGRRGDAFLELEGVTEDLTLYAVYVPYRIVTLVYTEENNEQVKVYQDLNEYGLPTDDSIADENPGYYCTGWYTDPSFAGSAKVNSVYYADWVTACYAKWEKCTYQVVLLDENGDPYEGGVFDRTYQIGDSFDLPEMEDTDEYEFLGWKNEDGSATLKRVSETTYGSFTLSPHWRRFTSEFSLYVDGEKIGTVNVPYHASYELGIPSSLDPKQFQYWYFEADGEQTPVTDREGNSLSDWTKKGGTYTVYANYLPKSKVEVLYVDPQTGENVVEIIGDFVENETVTIRKPSAIGDNYDVRGWYISGTLQSTAKDYSFAMPDHALRIEMRYSLPVGDFTMMGALAYRYNGHYYAFIQKSIGSWDKAQEMCRLYGGHLATISSRDENDYIFDLIKREGYKADLNIFLGATDRDSEGNWKWVTGETYGFNGFASGEPSSGTKENYLTIYKEHFKKEIYGWSDGADQTAYYVCEWDSAAAATVVTKVLPDPSGELQEVELFKYGGHYYYACSKQLTWLNAERYAESVGGHLVTISSEAENAFLQNLRQSFLSSGNALIGLTDYFSEGSWEWVTGEPVSYTHWCSGQPDDNSHKANFVHFYSGDGWDDYTGDANVFFVEWDNVSDIGNERSLLYGRVEISTVSDLMKLTTAHVMPEAVFVLTNDIDMAGVTWTPNDFGGILDGNGHTIRNLSVSSSTGALGVFKKITGTVKDLTFENLSVESTSYQKVQVGGLAAESTATVENVVIRSGDIRGDVCDVGGLIGTVSGGEVRNCKNYASVSGESDGNTAGIVGYLSSGKVLDCENYGTVIGGGTKSAGVVGDLEGGTTVSNCKNAGEVTGAETAGGVIGYVRAAATLTDLRNEGAVVGRGNATGGVIGSLNLSGDATFNTVFLNTGNITGKDNTGGIVGYLKDYHYTNYGATYVVSISRWKNDGRISGENYTGGLIGYCKVWGETRYSGSGLTQITVTGTQNAGDITGTTHVGGLIGYADSNHVDSVVKDSESKGAVFGEWAVGGLAGQLSNIRLLDSTNAGSTVTATGYQIDDTEYYAYLGGYVGLGYIIENCSNAVALTYTERGGRIGGIAGYTNGAINACINTAVISAAKANWVGGIAGAMYYNGDVSLVNLENIGSITGKNNIGGIVGYLQDYHYSNYGASYTVSINKWTNSGSITGEQYSGGIIGYCKLWGGTKYSGSGLTKIKATVLKSNANVTGTTYVGGLVGYAYANNGDSSIKDSSSQGVISGEWMVGGLAGKLEYICLTDSTNAGSTVTATGYQIDGTSYYAYLGGYVGSGYIIENCENAVALTYTERGGRIGGIVGYTDGAINACTNTADVTATKSDCVGGIVGAAYYGGDVSLTNLENTGNITGKDNTGGIFGYLKDSGHTVTISKWTNGGVAVGKQYTGGLIGYNNQKKIMATYTKNTGSVTGTSYVGGIVGYAHADNSESRIIAPETPGSVTGTGDYVNQICGKLENITVEE